MILSFRSEDYSIPYKSTCVLHSNGLIHNGDIVTITSPLFASIDFSSKSINTSDKFQVPIKLNSDEILINKDLNGNNMNAFLYCNNDDTLDMYVKLS